ncbi:hypothetical protein CYMTET_28347 [Cymbomonas tetramitiformis]|uniref:Uncharacterized protein n=1 Tax=Cymbomonas tetramitiformis TaxID=36881 RepID=A0AAE0FNB3_9CHLO|nr:hypothetical protein CYMTET_28347 [Cymbomonas tetramitiformis]
MHDMTWRETTVSRGQAAREGRELDSASAFDDAEDGTAFARPCAQHGQPLVRNDEEGFTFAHEVDVGLRAQYVELQPSPAGGDPQHSLFATRVHDARRALAQLKQRFIDGEPPFEQSFMDNMPTEH